MERNPRIAGLDSLALGLLLAQLLLRIFVSSGAAAWGTNLLIHALIWPAAVVWCLARFLEGRFPLRLSGLEIPLGAWSALCVLSILRASYKLPAIDAAAAFVSIALIVPGCVHAFGPERRGLLANALLAAAAGVTALRSEEHTSELQSLR